MIQDEMLFFLNCLNDHLHNRKTSVPENIDVSTLIPLAKRQDLTGILCYQLKDSLSGDSSISTTIALTVTSFTRKKHEYEVVAEKLKNAGVSAVPVKGLELAQYYPIPALRTMGDIDLLIHDEDKPTVNSVMEALGYVRHGDYAVGSWAFFKNKIEFEFHPDLISLDEVIEEKTHALFFNDYWKYVQNGRLKDEFHFLFLFSHLRKHILNRGAGFRQFMDIAVMTDKLRDRMDWKWVSDRLEELKLKKFSDVVFSCNNTWFGIEPPYAIQNSSAEDIDMIAERIFDGGVFGFHAEDADSALLGYQMSSHGRKLGKIKSALRSIFPPYSLMRTVKQYEFVNNKPWLLPIAWIYRFFVSIDKLKSKLKPAKRSSDAQIERRIEYIRMLGLDQ